MIERTKRQRRALFAYEALVRLRGELERLDDQVLDIMDYVWDDLNTVDKK